MIIDRNLLNKTPIAEGGEGIIFEHKGIVLKIFKESVNKNEKLEKIKKLINKKLPQNTAKPLDLVFDKNNAFLGYSMKKFSGFEIKQLANKKFCQINHITVKDITRILVEIKETLKAVHAQNIHIGDLNERNILIDNDFNTCFIDVDSWSVENLKTQVCMETFKDPLLVGTKFSKETDAYAFAVLIFRLLTRLHPFGGKTDPDMDLLERMKRNISVIERPEVMIPKAIVRDWDFISPELIKDLKGIYEKGKRVLIDENLDDLNSSLKLCQGHKDYYYSKFNLCPVCNKEAKVEYIMTPRKAQDDKGIPYILLFKQDKIRYMVNERVFVSEDGRVRHKDREKGVPFMRGNAYDFSNNGEILYEMSKDKIYIKTEKNEYEFDKLYGSKAIVRDNKLYYVNLNCSLIELTVTERGNYSKTISKVTINHFFNIVDDKHYFICNVYDDIKVINVNGFFYEWKNKDRIVQTGIHFDYSTKLWLFIIENQKGKFETRIFNKNQIVFETDKDKYSALPGCMCFSNNIIYRPGYGSIIGFSWEKNAEKEFSCEIVSENSMLLKKDKSFIVVNEDSVYQVG
ncbi:MAG: hypothetical protein N2645_13690 [Clostridia bacterium]|nr:hypothetical protein [Clostridia bacterium]